jgi:hypothetical protein
MDGLGGCSALAVHRSLTAGELTRSQWLHHLVYKPAPFVLCRMIQRGLTFLQPTQIGSTARCRHSRSCLSTSAARPYHVEHSRREFDRLVR